MNIVARSLAALAVVVAASLPAAAEACPDECTPRCHMTDATVRAWVPTLLVEEGLGSAAAPFSIVQRVELDGEPSTEEALVTVVAPELCGPALACPTLVVACRGDRLIALGHGRNLVPLLSRTRGWADLGVREPSLVPFMVEVTRALRFTGARYQ